MGTGMQSALNDGKPKRKDFSMFSAERNRSALRPALLVFVLLIFVTLASRPAAAGIVPDYDFQWVTIGAVGNVAYSGGPFDRLAGRGSVDYQYRMSRLEITSAQWLEFVNTFEALGDPYNFSGVISSGIVQDFSWGGPGVRYMLRPDIPNVERVPVLGLTWLNAARYTNWLHNDKAPTLEALETGAYDTSTWGFQGPFNSRRTDEATHLPGARFWIPTLDEWMKAAHYDTNRFGAGQGGWWDYPNGTNDPLVAGLPGIGQTSAGLVLPPIEDPNYLHDPQRFIPLGAYADVQSPWGLWDVSGGSLEWVEDWHSPEFPSSRILTGAPLGAPPFGSSEYDLIYSITSSFPGSSGPSLAGGFRIASTVPAPGPLSLLLVGAVCFLPRRRRQGQGSKQAIGSFLSLHSPTPVIATLMLIVSLMLPSPATAGLVPNYDFQWVTIGDVGNAAYPGSPSGTLAGRGSVGYRYRLSRTEVKDDQWVEFVNAYAQYIEDPFEAQLPGFTGDFIGLGLGGSYSFIPQYAKHPTNMSWRMAARYVNWLHNDKAPQREAFESGVYDTSTFTSNPDGTVNDQLTHAPDAKFWIPTLDEWMKGAYFDPNKGGPGSAGWWMYPGQFDDILPNGLPGEGLTNSGMVDFFSDTSSIFDVGQYPGGASAYGLLDTSGGMSEWTEEPGSFGSRRISKGSSFYHSDFSYWLYDPIFDLTGTPSELTTFDGLRIASAVPAPGALGLLGIAGMLSLSRRRRRLEPESKQEVVRHFSSCDPTSILTSMALGASLMVPASAAAGIVPDYDFQWVTIGDPGNPAWNDIPTALNAGRGSVNYRYRMTQTEVTVEQWFEFAQAYQPFAGDALDGLGIFDLTGTFIQFDQRPDGTLQLSIAPGAERYPADMTWRMAARYANWLHNDKALTAQAFQSGAYDTSTFTSNPDFSLNDQLTHSPGARFWIPTLDEWMKAGYYDPNLNGGAGGWWMHPGMSDVPLTVGLPGAGGQTNAAGLGFASVTGIQLPLDVASYPGIQSPWGLLDVSGGTSEWTEEPHPLFGTNLRVIRGSSYNSTFDIAGYDFDDRISSRSSSTIFDGFRIASAVPTPGAAALLLSAFIIGSFRRRRRCSRCYPRCSLR